MAIPSSLPRFPLGLVAFCLLAACGSGSEGNGAPPSDAGPNDADGSPADVAPSDGSLESGDASQDGKMDAPDAPVSDVVLDARDASGDGGDGGSDAAEDAVVDAPQDAIYDADPDADGGLELAPTCYYGDFDTDGVHSVACVTSPSLERWGLSRPELSGKAVGPVAVTRTGTWIAVAVRSAAGAPMRVLLAPVDDSEVPRLLMIAPDASRSVGKMAFSVDGKWLGVMADFDLQGTSSLYVTPVSTGKPRRVSPAPQSGSEVTGFAWCSGNIPGTSHLAYVGDLTTSDVHELWTVNIGSTAPATRVVSASLLGTTAGVRSDLAWDAQGRVLFRSNHESAGTWGLYRAAHDGSLTERVPGTSLQNPQGPATLGSFGVSPDGTSVAFSANSPDSSVFDVYVTSLKATPATQRVSQLPLVKKPGVIAGPAFGDPIEWNGNATRLAVVADWPMTSADPDDRFAAFVLPAFGSPGGTRVVNGTGMLDQNVRDVRFTSDGSLVVRGDLVGDGVFELFVVEDPSVADQDPEVVRFEEVPPSGDVLGLAEVR
ncbi:MAG: hypothetical protein CVU63_08055 [Deltaproteobacteria bacterium HGW-Deltaproteobacteria-20]|nr:MAG: hypothetical protein CVU63_08055 [Deltaproteobacteria bacterium HGW-Deltaproteobacteria-20]